MKITTLTLGLAALVLLSACQSGEHGSGDYGSVDAPVIELYDMGDPAGMMELEIDRSGTIYEAEADIRPEQLPANVLAAAKQMAGPGAVVTGAEIEFGENGKTYEVKFSRGSVGLEYVLDADANILEEERSIRRSEAPAAVMTNAMAAIPGTFKSVEILVIGDTTVYHVKTTKGGVNYKAVLSADGELLRAVREARAEIEIPLKR